MITGTNTITTLQRHNYWWMSLTITSNTTFEDDISGFSGSPIISKIRSRKLYSVFYPQEDKTIIPTSFQSVNQVVISGTSWVRLFLIVHFATSTYI